MTEADALEKRIASVYRDAQKDMQAKIDDYFAKFLKRDAAQKALLNAGSITNEQYIQWRLAQIGRGERFIALRDQMAERMTKANEVAAAYMNDATPSIYSLNRNYAAYTIEQAHGNLDFTLYDEQTVKRLIVEQPELMPHYPEKKAVQRGIDLAYGKKQITAQVTSGILLGKSIKHIADDLQSNITTMNRNSAIRTARTAVTGAQNAGHLDSYLAAAKLGVKIRKRWIAAKDGRTRHSHGAADGQTVALDEPFMVGGDALMFPADPSGKPANIYNCRCTMRTVENDGIEAEPRQMRVRDPVTGQNVLVNEMTYSEWAEWKNSLQHKGTDANNLGVPVMVGQVNFFDEKAVLSRLAAAEKELAGLNYEVNYTVTADGKVWRVTGEAGFVNLSAIPSRLKGSYSYHNHPTKKTWHSFSAEDTAFFIESGAAYSKASDDVFEYIMRRKTETIAISTDEVYHKFKMLYKNDVFSMAFDDELDMDMDGFHKTMELMSKELGFDYERKKKN